MILNIFAIIFIIEGIFAQNCKLNASDMNKKWIYAIKTSSYGWDVLHTDYIEDQTSLYLICKHITETREFFCNSGVLQEITTPGKNCTRHVAPKVVLQSVNDNTCRLLRGNIYNVVYNLPYNVQIVLYQVCYSTEKEQVLFTKHRAYGFDLPASTYHRPTLFKRSNIVSRERVLSFDRDKVYQRFNQLLGVGQTYIPNNETLRIVRGHLTNCQDFPTYDQMDATFQYVNVVPQFNGSNGSNWKRLENWLHRSIDTNSYADVVSGVYGILTLPHSHTGESVEMYLMPNQKNYIPFWLYKVVRYDNNCYAFAALNNDFNDNANLNTPICNRVTCPSDLEFTTPGSIAYCCNYYNLVRHVGNHAALCN